MQRVYDALLAVRGGEAGGEELHAPRLRLRLLRSLHALAQRAAQRLRDRQPGLSYMAHRSALSREVRSSAELLLLAAFTHSHTLSSREGMLDGGLATD